MRTSPMGRMLLIIFAGIFIVEFGFMLLLRIVLHIPLLIGLVDTLLLMLVLSPLVYLLFFRPMGIENSLRNAEKDLEETSAFNEALLQSVPYGMDVIDEEGNILFLNDHFRKLFGEDSLGKKCWTVYKDNQSQCPDCPLHKGLSMGESITFETSGVLGGRLFRIDHTGIFFHKKKAIMEFFHDITEERRLQEALRKNEALLEKAQRIAHVGSLRWSLKEQTLLLSDEAYRIIGCSKEEFIPTVENLSALLHPSCREKFLSDMEKALTEQGGIDLECTLFQPGGMERMVHIRAEVIAYKNGIPVELIGTIHDLTERVKVQDALQRSEESLKKAQNIANIGNYEINFSHGREDVYWSDHLYRIFGLTPHEVRPSFEIIVSLIHPDDREAFINNNQAALFSKTPYSHEYRIVRKDGQVRTVHSQAEIFFDSIGKPVKFVGVTQDITEWKLAEEALRRSERSLMRAQEIAHLGSFEWPIGSNAVYWSDEAYRILNIPSQSYMPAEVFWEYIHPGDREQVKKVVNDALTKNIPLDLEHRIILWDGSEKILHERGEVLFDESGKPVKMEGFMQDITRRKIMEKEIIRVHADKEKLEAVRILSLTFAHHIFNAIAPVKGYAELIMRMANEPEKHHEFAQKIQECADESVELVNRLRQIESFETTEFGGMTIIDIERATKEKPSDLITPAIGYVDTCHSESSEESNR